MQKKYIIANIQIPMEVFQDGKYESLTDYLTVDFIKCDKLPEKPINLSQTTNQTYKKMMSTLFQTQEKVQVQEQYALNQEQYALKQKQDALKQEQLKQEQYALKQEQLKQKQDALKQKQDALKQEQLKRDQDALKQEQLKQEQLKQEQLKQDQKPEQSDELIKLSINVDEIKPYKRGHNISFKNTHHDSHNYSMKNREL